MSLLPFARRTHIDNLQLGLPLVQFVHAHLAYSFQRESRRVPCFHSTNEVAGEFCKAGAHEQAHDSFKIVIAFHDEKDRFFGVKHPSRPDGENWRAANVERSGNMAASKRKHGTHIHENARLLVDCFLERLGRKSRNAWKVSQHLWPLRIQSFHDWIIMRDRRRTVDRVICETFRVAELQKFIKFSLVTDRAAQPRSNVRSAG